MERYERELLVARIASGTLRVSIENQGIIIIKQPTRDQVYIGQEIYAEVFKDSELHGLYTEDELYDFLIECCLWDEQKEKLYVGLPKDIEEFKLKLFKLTFKSNERQVARKALALAKTTLDSLSADRSAYTHLSCSGAAYLARTRYMLGCSMYYSNGKPVFTSDSFWEEPSDLLDRVIEAQNQVRIDEVAIRELARMDPWRTIWLCRRGERTLFGVSPVDYTEEQRHLVGWSSLYDNIYEHPDCPSHDIIEDNDMLDGWLIDQRKQREARQTKKSAEELIDNEKIRGSEEIFLPAQTLDDARRVNELNDEHTKHLLRQRFAHIKEKGVVAEQDMPDTKRKLTMQRVQMMMQKPKG